MGGGQRQPGGPPHGADTGVGSELRDRVNASYERYHSELSGSEFDRYVRFMNYGYTEAPNGTMDDSSADPSRAASRVRLPPRLPNRNAARLVVELIGAEPLDGRTVVDVGCGRGGALWLIQTYLRPRVSIGIDLSMGAVRAASEISPAVRADAESLPLAPCSVDVVLNIESSLHYPWIGRFFGEVARVLRPGGAFLYTDLVYTSQESIHLDLLLRSGFDVECDRDITHQVLASRSARAARESLAFDRGSPATVDVERFVGTEGTAFQAGLSDGTWRYRIIRLRRSRRRPEPAMPPGPAELEAVTAATDALGGFGPSSS